MQPLDFVLLGSSDLVSIWLGMIRYKLEAGNEGVWLWFKSQGISSTEEEFVGTGKRMRHAETTSSAKLILLEAAARTYRTQAEFFTAGGWKIQNMRASQQRSQGWLPNLVRAAKSSAGAQFRS